MLNAAAAISISFNVRALAGSFQFPKTARRESLGSISFNKLKLFSAQLWGKSRQPGHVPSGSRKTSDEYRFQPGRYRTP